MTQSGFPSNLNDIGDHVWAFLLLLIGVGLVTSNHKDTGELIIGAGLAVFRTPVKNDDDEDLKK